MILEFACYFAICCLALAMACCTYRIFKGPTPQDRALGTDALSLTSMLFIFTLGILFGTTWYYEIGLIVALVGFVSSAGLAKFLLRGEVIEP
ncbi:K+/H+ antiporter subunit F [Brackiella oedipodis]|uniref:K+/H+ antiporter subunit F n=1 Tax=Brackiella oedipodis TaxID=124225 RepID=UPI00056EDC64|nr:K+/H+ antiporter subunit F [Brackiella oedipodis]